MTGATTPGAMLAAALVEAQRTAAAVPKAARNEHHGYDYASAEDIIREARSALAGAGLAFHALASEIVPWPGGSEPAPSPGDRGPPPAAPAAALRVTYRLAHVSGEALAIVSPPSPVIVGKGRPLDRALFAARTLDLAYALRDLLLLPRGEDTQGEPAEDPRPRAEGAKAIKAARDPAEDEARARAREEVRRTVARWEDQLGGPSALLALAAELGIEWPPTSPRRAREAFAALERTAAEAAPLPSPEPRAAAPSAPAIAPAAPLLEEAIAAERAKTAAEIAAEVATWDRELGRATCDELAAAVKAAWPPRDAREARAAFDRCRAAAAAKRVAAAVNATSPREHYHRKND